MSGTEPITIDKVPADAKQISADEFNPDTVFNSDASPADYDETQKRAVLAKAAKLRNAVEQADKTALLLNKTIQSESNPSPIIVCVVIVGSLLIIWGIYLLFLKPCIGGEWRDSVGNMWQIKHKGASTTANVKINGDCAGKLKVIDNYVRYGDLIGIWDYNNDILFTNGVSMSRVL